MQQPLISIVVPTKNRYKYLKHLIVLINSFNSNIIELVIQDNSDSNEEILDFLEKGVYPEVRYYYSTEKLSMSENSNLAILNSMGEYICFIGDDDGVCRNIIDCAKWMKLNDFEALRSVRTSFVWGDSNKRSINNISECVIYNDPLFSYVEINPMKELYRILKKGFQTLDFIPILYNGIVKKTLLQEIYKIGNTYFPGGSPDISNGVALSFLVKKMAYVNFPVVISGTSQMTGGGVYRKKGRTTELENVGFISQSVIDNWEHDIPRIWAGRLAWPESGIKSLRYMNHPELIDNLNRNYMYAAFAVYYRQHMKIAYRHAPDKILWYYYIVKIVLKNGFRVIMNKIESFFRHDRFVGKKVNRNIKNIESAENLLMGLMPNFNLEDIKREKK